MQNQNFLADPRIVTATARKNLDICGALILKGDSFKATLRPDGGLLARMPFGANAFRMWIISPEVARDSLTVEKF